VVRGIGDHDGDWTFSRGLWIQRREASRWLSDDSRRNSIPSPFEQLSNSHAPTCFYCDTDSGSSWTVVWRRDLKQPRTRTRCFRRRCRRWRRQDLQYPRYLRPRPLPHTDRSRFRQPQSRASCDSDLIQLGRAHAFGDGDLHWPLSLREKNSKMETSAVVSAPAGAVGGRSLGVVLLSSGADLIGG
jgi:hypothetical protein